MQKNMSTEERLMELIDNPAMVQRAGKGKRASTTIDKLLQRVFSKKKLKKILELRTINKILFFAAVFLSIYFVVQFNSLRHEFDDRFYEISVVKTIMGKIDSKKNTKIDYNLHWDRVTKRNLFTLDELGDDEAQDSVLVNDMAELDNISIVGFMVDGHSSQVLIEDKDTANTSILSVGETIKGYTVKSIEEGKVVLKRGTEEFVFK